MDPSRLAEIDALFEEALDLPAEARAALLESRAAGDPELRAEVESLLARSGQSVASLFEPVRAYAAALEAPGADELAPGETVGAYRLIRQLGQGGMGVVYLAERIDGTFERQVALKLLPGAGPAGTRTIERFEQERQILARLAHPGIAHLLDGGVDRRGLPYLVMEHVDGLPIDRWCDEHRLTLAERLRLVVEIADAVQAAHRNLVVHRDIKPSNVLVDASGRVKLLDFGIAKLLDTEPAGGRLTVTQAHALTPTYASPEQVNGETITTAVDVYQLGLLLYELATGHRPQESRTSSLAELVDLVCRHEPAPPSRAVQTPSGEESPGALADLRRSTPAKLARHLRPEIDAIVSRALAKDPERRYPTPASLAADVERYLEGRPVQARRPSLAFRARRWVARNAALAASGAVAILALAGYAATVTVQSRAIDRQRERAEDEATKAQAVERFLTDLFETSDPAKGVGRDITARELLSRGTESIDRELADEPAVQARLWSVLGQIHENLGEGEKARELLERALAAQTRIYGEEHAETARTLHRLGILQRHRIDRVLGEQTLTRTLAIQRRVLPAKSEELAKTLHALGVTRNFVGDSGSAERFLAESLEIFQDLGSLRGIAMATSSLGVAALNRGDLDGAEARYREALALNRQLLGECHPAVGVNLYNIANVLGRRGDVAAALEIFRQVTAIDTEAYGSKHSEVGIDLVREAAMEQRLGRLERADELYRQSFEILLGELSPTHLRVQEARMGLGQLRVRQERFAEAEPLLKESLEARRRRMGDGHSSMRSPLLWHGRALAGLGRRDEAIAAWREAMAIPAEEDELAGFLRRELEAAGAPVAGAPVAGQAGAGESSAR